MLSCPRALRRALVGFLTPPTALIDELPASRRPSRRAVFHSASEDRAPARLRVLSYNLQRAFREHEILRSLTRSVAEHSPDVLLLQEAPRGLWAHPTLAPVFSGRNLFYAPFHQIERDRASNPDASNPDASEYGQVIATRFALERPEVIELPTVTRAGLGRGHLLKRIALQVEIPTEDGRTLRVVNVHHEPFVWPRGREPQHAEVLRGLPRDESCIDLCIGDFNAAFGIRREPGLACWWREGFKAALPSGRHLDNALVRGHRSLCAVLLEKCGSDHRPLLLQVEI